LARDCITVRQRIEDLQQLLAEPSIKEAICFIEHERA
jgi:hypothetical protein